MSFVFKTLVFDSCFGNDRSTFALLQLYLVMPFLEYALFRYGVVSLNFGGWFRFL